MLRSLYSGISGLKAHQVRMDVIGNNIANVNTLGFKKSRVTFQDLFSQTLRGASRPNDDQGGSNPLQVGLGTSVGSIDKIMEQGNLQPTGKSTDLAIDGEGFFVLTNANGDEVFSRLGAFDFDATGTFVNSDGLKVQGYVADPATGTISKTLGDIVIPRDLYLDPKSTTELNYVNNLDSSAAVGTSRTVTKAVYDSEGQAHKIDMTYTKVADNEWRYTVGLAKDDPLVQKYLGQYYPNFDTLSTEAQQIAIEAAQVNTFEPDATTAYIGKARATLDVPPAQASEKIMGGDLIVTAVDGGPLGDDISMEFVKADGNDANTSVEVKGNNVVVHLGTDASGALDPSITIDEIVNRIALSPASALISAQAAAGAGGTAPSIVAPTYLKGGAESVPLNVTAVDAGLPANNYSVIMKEVTTPSQPLTVTVTGDQIMVSLETDGNGRTISTLQEVVSAINGDPTASTMVETSIDQSYNQYLAGKVGETQLQGGFPQGLEIKADFPGVGGNDISIEIVPGTTADTTATTNGKEIMVTLGTANNTLADVVNALNSNPDTAILVDAYVDPAVSGNPASTVGATNLVGGTNSINSPRTGSLIFDTAGQIDEAATSRANLAGSDNLAKSFSFDPINPDAGPVTITPDFSALTQFSSEFTVVARGQDGNPASTINDLTVEKDGTIIGDFVGGYRKVLGKVAMAGFTNPAGLDSIGGGLYAASGNSGDPDVGGAQTLGRGSVMSNALEMSNVDLAEEFTNMITTQRGFQANSRTITTSDELLQELVNLKR
ncbi:flagellar hook-basal body complex protein [Metallumcola ferriviriculae]|uniref:Flagellar hook protein FlgE n=1 Tax=Metallumcola ferriviriculae TaxID=3039180 RepID=A0AAU0UTB6_9FIRM|nr:flagellar hook-basal body complex protein [Desulfitibacteraceae bacterium MK1]